jgi:excisionase family DNA binding protein
MPKLLMNIKFVASTLNMAEITLRRKIKKNEISYHKIGKKYYFTRDDLEDFIFHTSVPRKGKA